MVQKLLQTSVVHTDCI